MKIVFISTLLTPHQIPFCDCLNCLAEEFCFIQTAQAGESWESKGQTIYHRAYPYLLSFCQEQQACEKKLLEADLVIAGGVDLRILKKRMQKGKLVFVYLERFYKNGITVRNIMKAIGGTFLHHGIYQKYHPYLLCASGYCAGDAALFGNYHKRTLKWGYFPQIRQTDPNALIEKKETHTIIWVGRLIDWKHPDDMLLTAKRLKQMGYHFQLKLLGDGEMRRTLEDLIMQYDLSDCVKLCGSVTGEQVREEMDRSVLFVSTSDYGEGWGAVLNEAMNSGCAVIASHAVGAAPFLIKDGENGYVYQSGDIEELVSLCAKLLDDPILCQTMGARGYHTIATKWNAQTAAERLIKTASKIISGENKIFEESGPCSYAEPWKQNQVYGMIKNDPDDEKSTGGNATFSK